MKIRTSLVSNSSSSSFIIQGIVINGELGESLYNKGWSELRNLGLSVEQLRDFFSGNEPEGYIVGISLGEMEDGVPMKISPKSNSEIVEKLKQLEIPVEEKDIEIYVQFISNDNY
jgi:hypothetical protein